MNIQGRNGMAIEINFLAMQFLELYNINEHVMEEEQAGECGEERLQEWTNWTIQFKLNLGKSIRETALSGESISL